MSPRSALVVGLLLASAGAFAEGPSYNVGDAPAGASSRPFTPPQRGAPERRVGGATRGFSLEAQTPFRLLAPAATARTARPMPTLYWELDAVAAGRLHLSVVEEGSGRSLLEADLPQPVRPGLQSIELRKFNKPLQPGRGYRWALDWTPADGAETPSRAEARISYAPAGDGAPQASEGPMALASQGYWYDAFALAVQGFFDAERQQLLQDAGLGGTGARY